MMEQLSEHRISRRGRAVLERLVDSSSDALLVIAGDGRIQEVNCQAERLLGYFRHELIGSKADRHISNLSREIESHADMAIASDAQLRSMEPGLVLDGRHRDGSEFPVDVLLCSVRADGEPFVLVFLQDLSRGERRDPDLLRLEERLPMRRLQAFSQLFKLAGRLREEAKYLEGELRAECGFEEIIGESPALEEALNKVGTAAPTEATILIEGETGTGKEMLARAIHNLGPRCGRTFVKLNCSAIPLHQIESEMFGQESGAFRGVLKQKVGRLELAHRGTLFIDEIGDLPPELQPKLVRALREKKIARLGGTNAIPSDFRLIAATARNLPEMATMGDLSSGLYQRLKVFPIGIAPLRERRGDIPPLIGHFVAKHARRRNKSITTVPDETMKALKNWPWPGNVRELENFIERAVILTCGSELQAPVAELGDLQAAASRTI